MRDLSGGKAVTLDDFQRMIKPSAELRGISPGSQYGLGMFLWNLRGSLMCGHIGEINGFTSALAYLPKEDVTVVVLANDQSLDARILSRRLATIAIGKPYPDVAAVSLSAEQMQLLTGTYGAADTRVRTILVQNGRLYSKRAEGNVLELQATANGELHFNPDGLSYFLPVRNGSGKVIAMDYFEGGDGPAQRLARNQ
jgi:CubicO group peptidase (beta-lactamase class C family)